MFADKANTCGLGGPPRIEFIEQCSTQLEAQFSDDQCDAAEELMSPLSCEDFRDLLCAEPGAEAIYDCSGSV